jgi:hypothetical protein
MRHIALFKSSKPVEEPKQKDPERATVELSRAIAFELLATLRAQGVITDAAEPDEGDGGWFLVAKVGKQRFSVFLHWLPINGGDCFACQTALKRGVFKSLFFRDTADVRLQPIVSVLEKALLQMQVLELRWLTDEEFRKVY